MNVFVINIKTETWNSIIESLIKDGWKVKFKYGGFDRGIDHDYLELRKGKHKIEFGWDNWCEGEIKAEQELMSQMESQFNLKFQYGDPHNLKASVIALSRLHPSLFWLIEKIKSIFLP